MKGSPNKKVPWIHWEKVNDGQPMGDSTLIMNELVRLDPATYDLDAHLTTEQKAIATAFKTMLEEATYFTGILQSRWIAQEQCDAFTRDLYFASVPSLIRGMVTRMIRSVIVRNAQGHGTANVLNEAQIFEKFQMELDAVAEYLGEKPYFMGDQVSSVDATVFAYLAVLVQGEWNHQANLATRNRENVMAYLARMQQEFWPELQKTS